MRNGTFDSSAEPTGDGTPEPGHGATTSTAPGYSSANRRPRASRLSFTERPKIILSGREKYTCSNTQCCCCLGGAKRMDSMPDLEMRTISPGSTSRTYCALRRSNAQVSEATIQASAALSVAGNLPSTNGGNPRGSGRAYKA